MGIRILSTLKSAGREILTANRSYYVATTGSDNNDGLSSSAPFLTIQKAIDVSCSLDLSIYSVTINVGLGTYTDEVVLKSYIGVGPIHLKGDETTPSNVLISVSEENKNAIKGFDAGLWQVSGFKLLATNNGISAGNNSHVRYGYIDFGVCTEGHISSEYGSRVSAYANYTISGGARKHASAWVGTISIEGVTVTITGTPAFGYYFVGSAQSSVIHIYSTTFSGSATGKQYDVTFNSVVFVNGAGTSYLPGSVAGTTATGGQYA